MFARLCNFDGNQEARACAWNSLVQGILIANQIFLTVALLRLAEKSAGCEDVEVCDNRVYGMRPSSLLTTVTALTGLLGSFLLPIAGALIDRSEYRRGVGITSGVLLLGVSGLNLVLSEETWFFCLMTSVVNTLTWFIHQMVVFSYIPELTDDHEKLAFYNGTFLAIRTATMGPFLPVVIIAAFLINGKPPKHELGSLGFDVMLAKISQVTCLTFGAIFLFLTFWKGLKTRPVKVQTDGNNRMVIETAKRIYSRNKGLFWYLLALIPFSNTVVSFAPLAITFMTSFLKMGSVFVVINLFVFIIFGILGSIVHPFIAKRINLMNDLKVNVVCWAFTCLITGFLVNKPEKRKVFMGLVPLWGLNFGWAVPSMRTLYITLIPCGQEAEYMGIYSLFSSGFVWLPPLMFTVWNEMGLAMNKTMLIFSSFFFLTFVLLTMVGDYKDAVENSKALQFNPDSGKGSEADDPSNKVEGNDVEVDVSINEHRTQCESDDSAKKISNEIEMRADDIEAKF